MNTTKEILEISEELLNHMRTKENWSDLSDDRNFDWSMNLIKKYADKIDWLELSKNKNINWDIETIELFKDNINWKEFSESFVQAPYRSDISSKKMNRLLILERFIKYWDWNIISEYIEEPSEEEMDRFIDKWNWELLIDNYNIKWSETFYRKYKKYFPIQNIQKMTNSKLWDKLKELSLERLKAKLLLES
jgi:hypothetical protein